MRIGTGYDVHPLVAGRNLVLGGVTIPFDKGLNGWSDADVLCHVIIDALLGAAAFGDRGSHFPPGEPEYKGISSLELLRRVKIKLSERQWRPGNIDATVIAERPKLRSYIDRMRQEISKALDMDISQVSVKASTSSGLGFTGRGEGIAAQAVALIERVNG